MRATDIMLVGPAGKPTGGIAQYIREQRQRLGDGVSVRVYDVAVDDTDSLSAFLWAALQAVWQVLCFPFRRPPDVLHVHSSHWYSFFQSSLYVFFASVVWEVPVVFHIHGSSFDSFVQSDSRLLRWYQSLVFEHCDNVIVLSEYWQEIIGPRVGEEKTTVLPNAVDPDEYEPEYGARPPHVVFVSNHIERKGIREFTEAVDELLARGEDCRVTIAGSGPLSHLAENLAERHPEVTYEGYVSEERKRELLCEGSVFVLPTHAENLPIALLEAMAGGNALLTTTVGAIPSLIDGNGVLVAPGDADSLAANLSDLINDPEQVDAMGARSRAQVEREYSWPVTVERLEELYRRLQH
ncbi:Glycosyltransferase involved in cell wall bisynthesis [Halopelagius inordinatus]|uniref:Glycosyltransferase involved in cell wall bisynthesis n=1 Tax=Halopelagius inordinatus TaxID=553467 RepID=A0A1I2UAY7_9EURY|nr:glycosyltransferase family 4 protein [Halopelagius inordinatus]SFG74355.1 Glycosyltransferase involved in cell wall bisynthesis [Halopelagius inordinatus]